MTAGLVGSERVRRHPPPPRSIRPTVRRLPRSPRLSGPGPHRGRRSPRLGDRTSLPALAADSALFGGLRWGKDLRGTRRVSTPLK